MSTTTTRRCYYALLPFILLAQGVLSQPAKTIISNANELVNFSKSVGSGTSYEGITVFLDSDIEFTAEQSKEFEPIGKNSSNFFHGTFDGQGHVISNLNMNLTQKHVGLFGYSEDTTIKNVVIDGSCSFTSRLISNSENAFIGGIVSHCKVSNKPFILENNVNMAGVSFSGSTEDYAFIGGIVGQFVSHIEQESIIKNCINYGPITYAGHSGQGFMLGGIAGEYYGKSMVNCFNYGTILNNGTTGTYIIIGGIVGKSWNNTIENCLSAGKIESNMDGLIGGVLGNTDGRCLTNITHSFWTNETGYANSAGEGNYSIENSYQTELNSSVMKDLNEYASKVDPSCSWIVLHLNGGRLNKDAASYETVIATQKNFPYPVKKGHTFLFWCKDIECIEKYEPNMTGITDLYAIFIPNNYTVTFMSDEEVIQSGELPYGSNIPYPTNPTKKGHSFVRWDSNPTTVPDKDITITAIFIINNYTMAFDFDNGTVIEKEYQYNASIEYPKNVDRKGYVFIGWNNTLFEFMPDHNVITKALWNGIIRDAEELIDFSKSVNSGTNFEGMTVFLDSDIDFTAAQAKQFEPIGKNSSSYFNGTFDGQGYVIKNLALNSTYQHSGLFGYSEGATIRNVVLDESCSIENRFNSASEYTFTSGVIGHCNPKNDHCILENNVNMGSIAFSGNAGGYNFIGGIIGLIDASNEYERIVRSCINYGSITHAGYSGEGFMIGGIAGECYGKSMVNCINYGTVTNSGESRTYIFIGGIIGKSRNMDIENCLSAGKIITSKIGSVGSIVGEVNGESITKITHSFWTNETGYPESSGKGTPLTDNSYQKELNSSVMEEMKEYASKKNLSCSWIVLHLNGGKLNKDAANYKTVIATQKHFPEPVKEGHTFQFWCTDAGCTRKYDHNMTGITDLYAKFIPKNYTVTFVSDGQTILSKSLAYGSKIPYPTNPTKKSHTFVEWDSNPIAVPDNDIIITAIFIPNNYVMSFDLDNGTVIEKEYQYNARIEYPLNIVRKGYVFLGWDNTLFEFMPDNNITTKALWNETTQFVEIVFGTKDMSKKEIENVIKEIVDDDIDFVIEGFEVDKDTGETRVVIKFIDREKAENFVESVKESSNSCKKKITVVGFIPENPYSLAQCFCLLSYFYLTLF